VYEVDRLQSDRVVCIDQDNPYFTMLHKSWGQRLREVFDSIEDPQWNGGATEVPLRVPSARYQVLKKITQADERVI
jgi:putative proteasome-type protease